MIQATVHLKDNNFKSNVVITTLLFVLCPLFSLCYWPVADTLILDGDTIYIEKRERVINIDSLQEELNKDIIAKRIPQHRLSLAFEIGRNNTVGTFHSAYQSYLPLDKFLGVKYSVIGNMAPSVDLGFRVWNTALKHGELQLSAHSGFGYNEINIRSYQMEESPFEQDSLIQLHFSDDQFFLEYFTIFDTTEQGIIGELDTVFIQTNLTTTRYRTWDIPLKLRVSYFLPTSKIAIFTEVGVVYRKLQSNNQQKNDQYLVNSDAEYQRFDRVNFMAKDIMSPTFTLGLRYHFCKKTLLEPHWSWSFATRVNAPPRVLNPEGFYNFQTWSYGLMLSVGKTF